VLQTIYPWVVKFSGLVCLGSRE